MEFVHDNLDSALNRIQNLPLLPKSIELFRYEIRRKRESGYNRFQVNEIILNPISDLCKIEFTFGKIDPNPDKTAILGKSSILLYTEWVSLPIELQCVKDRAVDTIFTIQQARWEVLKDINPQDQLPVLEYIDFLYKKYKEKSMDNIACIWLDYWTVTVDRAKIKDTGWTGKTGMYDSFFKFKIKFRCYYWDMLPKEEARYQNFEIHTTQLIPNDGKETAECLL